MDPTSCLAAFRVRGFSTGFNQANRVVVSPKSNFLTKLIPCLFMLALSAGAQQFTAINPSLPALPRPSVTWADYDGDGDLDLLIAGEGGQHTVITKLYNNNAGVFTDSGIILNPLQVAGAAWGDFDNDGDLDLAMTGQTAGGSNAMYVYRNDGGNFTSLPGSFLGVAGGGLAWGDYDNDGDLDLLVTGVAGSTAASAQTRLYRNDGNGSFVSVAHPFPAIYVGAVTWGDFDSDGDLDVIITGTSASSALNSTIWRNDGKGNFSDAGANLPGADLGFARWGDYDNDGDLDLLFGGNSIEGPITRIYRNDNGTFVDIEANLIGLLWSSADWGDFDNDGDLDFILIGYDPTTSATQSRLYRNDGGVFNQTADTFIIANLGTVSWADYDNDGDLDLLIAGNGSNNLGDKLRIYRNNSTITNTPPSVPPNLSALVTGTKVGLSWQPASDGQTPGAALSYNLRVGTTPGGMQIVAPQSSSAGLERLPAMGNSQLGLGHRLRGLTPGTTYYWSAQSIDTGLRGSAFAAEGSFTATVDAPEPQSFVREPGGAVRVTWVGTPGFTYRVEASDDLQSWSVVANPIAAAGSGTFEFLDQTVSAIDARFYRAAPPQLLGRAGASRPRATERQAK
jgi:FG-GAP-like repeat